MVKKETVEQKWHEQSEAAKQAAAKLPHGKLKSELLRKASQLKTASQINLWLSSPGLQPPITNKSSRPGNKSSHPGVGWNG